jgi:hypothetical protein
MNSLSVLFRPSISPHHTKASVPQAKSFMRQALYQRQGGTFINSETRRAFIPQEDAYPDVVAFFRRNLEQHLKAFVEAGHRLPTGQELDIFWASLESYYLAKAKLLASHNNNVNMLPY